jgi:hypothetical protein
VRRIEEPSPAAWSALAHARAAYLLRRNGIDALVLKGPSIAEWLYPEGRTSADCDLLVSPRDLAAARGVLVGHGYADVYAGVRAGEGADHSTVFTDAALGDREVDLHTAFPGFGAPPERVWAALYERRTAATLAGVPVSYLDLPARALVLVLHAARNGVRVARGVEDVRRALAALDDAGWREVAALARDLDATAALAAGLRMTPEGTALASQLRLDATDAEWALLSASGSTVGLRLVQLRNASWPARAAMVRNELLPSAAFLRQGWPVARRYGALGLVAAYVQRLLGIARRLPRAIREVRATMGR